MKLISFLFLIFIVSCEHIRPQSASMDIFDKLILVTKKNDLKILIKTFGEPNEIKTDPKVKEVTYAYKNENIFEFGINPETNKIHGAVLTFWKDFDNYAFLKKRFERYKWIETKLPVLQNSHVATDRRQVTIPEIGIRFEYDDQDPKRHVMDIWFNQGTSDL